MNNVTTLPTAFTAFEETRQKVRDEIIEFLYTQIASNAEELKETMNKEIELYEEILQILPEDKQHLLFEYEEAKAGVAYLESEEIINYLLDHGKDLKNAIIGFQFLFAPK